MLAKKNRINKKLFDEVFKKGEIHHSDSLYIKILKTGVEKRFSFVITKKNVPGVIKRNLIKRRGYSIIKKNLKDLKPGIAVIFFMKKGADKILFKDLKEEIEKTIKKYLL